MSFRYDDKRVLVVGGATGMGAAAAQGVAALGAETLVMDVAAIDYPCTQQLKVDLRDRSSVDAALAQIDGRIDAVFSCAGIAGGPGTMLINFISQRYIVDALLAKGSLGRGSAVVMISSAAGMGWESNLETLIDFLGHTDWDAAAAWVDAHEGSDNYVMAKQSLCAYVAREAYPLLKQGVRLNAVLPGPTDTPLARANADIWLAFGEGYRQELGLDPLTPKQIGDSLIFLCSEAASGINGVNLVLDFGHASAAVGGTFEAPEILGLLGKG